MDALRSALSRGELCFAAMPRVAHAALLALAVSSFAAAAIPELPSVKCKMVQTAAEVSVGIVAGAENYFCVSEVLNEAQCVIPPN
jgi:hypothetical protein